MLYGRTVGMAKRKVRQRNKILHDIKHIATALQGLKEVVDRLAEDVMEYIDNNNKEDNDGRNT